MRRSAEVVEDDLPLARRRILESAPVVRIVDRDIAREFIRERQERGIDLYDEVWDGVYVVPPLVNNPHQLLVSGLTVALYEVVTTTGRGVVLPGANVSDRRRGWDKNFRDPDVVVVLKGSRAVDCGTHWMGGPDFLVEVQSPGDDTEEKLPFYSQLGVRELLIVHRDTRQLRLLRPDGRQLVEVGPSDFQGKKRLVSEVVPVAFRRKVVRGTPRTEVQRTDEKPGQWLV
jgi:Uma2 family endonuclease